MTEKNIIFKIVKFFLLLELGSCSIEIKKYESCKEYNNLPIQVQLDVVSNTNNKQTININASYGIPMKDINLEVRSKLLILNNWRNLTPVKEKDMCKAMNKYLGELWYDMERKMQIQPGVCPIAKGNYYLRNYVLDFSQMTLKAIPSGTIKQKIFGKRNDEVVFCQDSEIDIS